VRRLTVVETMSSSRSVADFLPSLLLIAWSP
jgi:hypothetical protein